jgi:uncharacterized protein YfaA (DUF2138 family)
MLIWINGTFGVGKTQTAHELQRRIPSSVVVDPEVLGFGIQRMYPQSLRTDFQDTPWWAPVTIEILADVAVKHDGHVIVPMTLVDSGRFAAVMTGLRQRGVDVRHFALLADGRTVRRRLRKRLDGKRSWAALQSDRCAPNLERMEFAEHVSTAGRSVAEVAEAIAAAAQVPIQPRAHPLRAAWARSVTQLRHIRLP